MAYASAYLEAMEMTNDWKSLDSSFVELWTDFISTIIYLDADAGEYLPTLQSPFGCVETAAFVFLFPHAPIPPPPQPPQPPNPPIVIDNESIQSATTLARNIPRDQVLILDIHCRPTSLYDENSKAKKRKKNWRDDPILGVYLGFVLNTLQRIASYGSGVKYLIGFGDDVFAFLDAFFGSGDTFAIGYTTFKRFNCNHPEWLRRNDRVKKVERLKQNLATLKDLQSTITQDRNIMGEQGYELDLSIKDIPMIAVIFTTLTNERTSYRCGPYTDSLYMGLEMQLCLELLSLLSLWGGSRKTQKVGGGGGGAPRDKLTHPTIFVKVWPLGGTTVGGKTEEKVKRSLEEDDVKVWPPRRNSPHLNPTCLSY